MVAAVVTLSVGCTRDEKLSPNLVEGTPVSISIQFGVEGSEVYTKAESTIEVENRVRNLFVAQFASNGDRLASAAYTVGDDGKISSYTGKVNEGDGATSGIINNFEAKAAEGCTFVALANLSTTELNGLESNTNLTYSELSDRMYTLTTEGAIDRTWFRMCALEENRDVDESMVSGSLGLVLTLKRLDAKVRFNVSVDIEGANDDLVFENLTYKVHNVPTRSYYIPRQRPAGATGQTPNTWDAGADIQGNYGTLSYYTHFDNSTNVGGDFTFYMLENRPMPDRRITAADKGSFQNLYSMREAWWDGTTGNVGLPVDGREFTYAPSVSTYVEITGHLEYSRDSRSVLSETEYVNADVTYIVHLGETGTYEDINDETRVNNYDVRRNVNYIYNVKITGVESMVVEVEQHVDGRPGNEGNLTITTDKQVEFDAHYGRVLLKINKANLENASWAVDSPVWGGITEVNSEGLITSPYDYKWVLFAINTQFGGDNESEAMVKFPGLLAYDGGLKFFNGLDNPITITPEMVRNDFGNNFDGNGQTFKDLLNAGSGDYRDNYYRNYIDKDACLRDINQLINYLRNHKNDAGLFNDQGEVYVTAFCEEFTYIYDPSREDYIPQGTSAAELGERDRRLALWHQYVDFGTGSKYRTMEIRPMATTAVSPDGNTRYTNSFITITQRPIGTIYNSGATTAWGLESINETGRLPDQIANEDYIGNGKNTTGNGRENFLNFFNDYFLSRPEWDQMMTTATSVENANGLDEDFRNPLYACISRNRDLNGNNVIEDNELLWYMASVDQLTLMFVAEDALTQDQRLYNGDGSVANHVMSSSYNGTWSSNSFDVENMWMIWAEEGASRGSVGGSKEANFDYRCVRNLGIDLDDIEDEPKHYATFSHTGGDTPYFTITLNNLNDIVLRGEPDYGDILPLSHERSVTDKPYRKFDVMENGTDSGLTWVGMEERLNNNRNPCPDGWRVPNLRELLVIISTINGEYQSTDGSAYKLDWWPLLKTQWGIATSFSFNGTGLYGRDRYGFIYDAAYNSFGPYANVSLLTGDSYRLYFRCVRDNTN